MEALVDPADCLSHLELDPRGAHTVTSTKYLLNHLPDLQLFKHPHKSGAINFASIKAMNGLEKVEFCIRNHDSGQTLELWLYSMIEGHQVYCKPPFYEVGKSHTGFGFVLNKSVLDQVDSLGLRFKLRKEINDYLASKSAIDY